jgi:putative transposase
MAASDSVKDVSSWLDERLAAASPDLLRTMIKQFAEALMSAEADAVCGAGYRERSSADELPQRLPSVLDLKFVA